MKVYKQKDLRRLVADGYAADITNDAAEDIINIASKCDKLGVSYGIYVINGGMLLNRDTGEVYAIIGRCANLFRVF